MTWNLTDEEFEAVSALPSGKRLEYAVKKIADSEYAWTLADDADNPVLGDDGEGHRVMPFWPHKRFAEACRRGAWSGYAPMGVHVEDVLDALLPDAREQAVLVSVFPVPDGRAATVSVDEFTAALEAELARY